MDPTTKAVLTALFAAWITITIGGIYLAIRRRLKKKQAELDAWAQCFNEPPRDPFDESLWGGNHKYESEKPLKNPWEIDSDNPFEPSPIEGLE